jgi:hypothetical protein
MKLRNVLIGAFILGSLGVAQADLTDLAKGLREAENERIIRDNYKAKLLPVRKASCIALDKNHSPIFNARRVACSKAASFFEQGTKCYLRSGVSKVSDSVNGKYCLAAYFDYSFNLLKVNPKFLRKIMRKRVERLKPRRR